MTTLTDGVATEATATATGLFDADGHILEDVPAIIERMSQPWRAGRERVLGSDLARLHGQSIFPPLGFLSSIPTAGKMVGSREPGADGRTPESWEFFLTRVGIERTVLYPTLGLTHGLIRDREYAISVTRAYNDWITDTYVRHPSGKFQAAAILPMIDPLAAAAELRRAVEELGLCAAVLPANGLPNNLGSRMYFPVYETAQELDVALTCHGGVHNGLGFDDMPAFAPAHALGFPFGLLISLAGLIFNNVFELYPRLRMGFLEGGAAWTLMAAERFSESFGATPSLSGDILELEGRSVKEYMAELMQQGRIVIGCEGGEHHLETAIEYFGCAPFMYSSDFPHEVNIASCMHELEELNELNISDTAKLLLRGGTARAFYKLG